jgi:cell wall-associated NlpC family hydrolase
VLTLSSLRRVPSGGRQLLATAGLASVAVVGLAVGGAHNGSATNAATPPGPGAAQSPLTSFSPASSSPATSSLGGRTINLAAATTPLHMPRITMSANHSSVYKGHPVTFTGTATVGTAPDKYEWAVLQRASNRGWHSVAMAKTAANGVVHFTVAPTSTYAYRIGLTTVWSGKYIYLGSTASPYKVVPAVDIGPAIVGYAARFKGHKYVYGAAGPTYFDCSGLVQYVYRQVVHLWLPHQSNAQAHYGVRISSPYARPGDLIFYGSAGHVYHAAIYAGHGMMWEAPHPGATVRYTAVRGGAQFRRLVQH